MEARATLRPRMLRIFFALALVMGMSGCRDGASKSEAPAVPEDASLPRVTLVAKNEAGVPLHSTPGQTAVSARLPDGTEVLVIEKSSDKHWLHVRKPGGASGWCTERYVAGSSRPVAPAARLPDASPWASRAACEAALSKKKPRPAGSVRLATWNIRWFPDGKPGKGRSNEDGTDIDWLACAIAWLDVDAIALQEIKTNEHAGQRSRALLTSLSRASGGKWRLETDECENRDGQHVALLIDEKKLVEKSVGQLASLNPNGQACKNQLRPGLGAYLTSKGGLDFHFVSVHAKSGSERRSFDLRQRSLRGIAAARSELLARVADSDVVIAGDFNTMGCSKCSVPVSSAEEISGMDRALSDLPTPFRRVPTDGACTERSSHGEALLDHFVVSRSMAELEPSVRAVVAGICREAACGAPRELPAEARLSDHCPVVLEIPDRDLD